MRNLFKNRPLALIIIIVLIVGLLSVVLSTSRSTDVRTRAQSATTIRFSPPSTPSTPLNAIIGTSLPLEVYISPNSTMVSYVQLEITYDPTYFDESSAVFVIDGTSPLALREGPVYESGKVTISLDIGNDVKNAITSDTKLGTLSLKPTSSTPERTTSQVAFGAATTVLSVGETDGTQENILSGTTPAHVSVVSKAN